MFVTVRNLSPGPALVNPERGVHIMRLVIDSTPGAAGTQTPGGSALAGAPPEVRNVGTPRPTDILVFEKQPYHFAAGGLHAHPQVHIDFPDTILNLSIGQQEKVVYW